MNSIYILYLCIIIISLFIIHIYSYHLSIYYLYHISSTRIGSPQKSEETAYTLAGFSRFRRSFLTKKIKKLLCTFSTDNGKNKTNRETKHWRKSSTKTACDQSCEMSFVSVSIVHVKCAKSGIFLHVGKIENVVHQLRKYVRNVLV